MEPKDPRDFEKAIGLIKDGFLFEQFCQSYLSQILGYEFMPVGGIKDRGIDGLSHILTLKGNDKNIYQISIEEAYKDKIEKSIKKLIDNKINFEQFVYVTNQTIKDKDTLIDNLFKQYSKFIKIFDISWLSANVNNSQGTINVYENFIDNHFYEYQKPGRSFDLIDLVKDPRLYVFLRQQLDENTKNDDLYNFLTDSLILYALEGTDPDKDIVKNIETLKKDIQQKIQLNNNVILPLVERRLEVLTTKPRKVKFHSKLNGYCLPYETRLEIQNRNINDIGLYENFKKESISTLKKYLKNDKIQIKDLFALIEKAIHQVFYEQGLEFSDFLIKGTPSESLEKNMYEVLSKVVNDSSVISNNKESVKDALLKAVREIMYNGSMQSKEFLYKLSHTYMMLFSLQLDPKVGKFFGSMASKLNIFVCTSIIIPALSEIYLDPYNRRHWILLEGASKKGVRFLINDSIVEELISHFRMVISNYESKYSQNEEVYLDDDIRGLYIDEILIRAYFYSKKNGKVNSFKLFIDNFISYDQKHIRTEIIEWLKDTFKIEYVTEQSLKIEIDKNEMNMIYDELIESKKNPQKTKHDAKTILTIYGLRAKNNETSDSSMIGYQTWWLSKDTTTKRALDKLLKVKYDARCYLRPDFLYTYISLMPNVMEIDRTYKMMFPSLLGINLSYHMPKDVIDIVNKWIIDHKEKSPARLKGILKSLTEELKSDDGKRSSKYVSHFLDDKRKDLEKL